MRILLYGCGTIGTSVIKQLQKNPEVRIITMDPREDPEALHSELIEEVDITESLTPMSVEAIVEEWSPDLILLATSSGDLALGHSPGLETLMDSLWAEIATISPVPVLPVDRRALEATHG